MVTTQRLMAGATLVMMLGALFNSTHELGDTAVMEGAYLWGESSIRCNGVDGIVWFVDSWEVRQQVFFALAASAAFFVTATGNGLWMVAPPFGVLVVLDLRRSFDVDGASWVAVTNSFFWLAAVWAVALCSVSLFLIGPLRGRQSSKV